MFLLRFALLSFTISTVALAADAQEHRDTLATAQELANEGSWERAKAIYLEALASAPNDEARRWCELWIEEASWRSEMPNRWRDGERWITRHLVRYDELVKPYDDGAPRDDFWVAVLTSRAEFEEDVQPAQAWEHRAIVADHLANQPPSPDAARRYVEFLQSSLASTNYYRPPEFSLLRPHLANGARIGATPADRGWCMWQLARTPDNSEIPLTSSATRLQETATRWATTLGTTSGTRWQSLVEAEELIWRIFSGWSPDLPPNSPADIPTILAEIRSTNVALANDETPAASELRQRLGNLAQALEQSHFTINMGKAFQPRSPIRFVYGTAGLARLDLTLERVAPAEWIALGHDEYQRSSHHPKITRPANAELVREWTIEMPDPARLVWSSQIVEAAPALSSGLYVLTARGKVAGEEPSVWQGKFTVSELRGLAVLSSDTSGKLFTFRAADGTPVSRTAVNGLARTNDAAMPWQGITDSRGAVVIPALDALSRELVAQVGDEPVWINYHGLPGGESDSLLIDAYADRPLFRPGETARWKLVVREQRGGGFGIPRDVAGLKVGIMLGDTPLLEETSVQLNAYGTLSGELKIPDDVTAGDATLHLFRGKQNRRTSVESSTSLFLVDRFVTPAVVADAEFTGDPRAFRPGQEITVRVRTAYFSGGPLVNAPVECRFSVSNAALLSSNQDFTKWASALHQQPQRSTTDASGIAFFKLMLPTFLPDNTSLDASAVVAPTGATAVNAASNVTISSSGLTLDPLGWTTPRLVHPGENVVFTAVIQDGRGSPVVFDGVVQLKEIRWSEVWLDNTGRIVSPEELAQTWRTNGGAANRVPDNWRLVHASYSENVVEDRAVRTGPDGRIDAAFAMPQAGLYRMSVVGDQEISPKHTGFFRHQTFFSSRRRDREADSQTDARRGNLSVVVADERTSSLALNPETAGIIAPIEHEQDEALTVLGIAPEGAGRAWASLRGATQMLAEPVVLRGRIAWHTFQQTIPVLGEATVELLHASIDPNARGSATATIPSSMKQFALNISVLPTREVQRPGESAEIVIAVTDSTGGPATAAELSVRASDEAVNSLVNTSAEEATPDFLNVHRTVEARTQWSAEETQKLHEIPDPRPGAIRNPGLFTNEDGEIIQLSPFSVSADATLGYTGSMSIAGSRINSAPKQQSGAVPPIELRSHFSSTAFWTPEVITDAKGEARITFQYPDNLTRWRIGAYAVGVEGQKFGTGTAFTRTSLPLQARLQLPRFLISGDSAEPSATLVNRTDSDLVASALLEITGDAAATDSPALNRSDITVQKQSETHVNWSIRAERPGEAQLTLTAHAGKEGDAIRLPLPILEDGIQQSTAAFSRLAPRDKRRNFSLELPATFNPARTQVSVQLSPNHATTILDALPYLIDYPYGCVEQTMSRFLPAVVVRKTLIDLGLEPSAVERRILASETPAGKKRREQSAGLNELDEVVDQSLTRLEEAHSYFGYGWWPGAISADLWMTAYVSWGLSIAASAGIEVPDELASSTLRAVVQGLQSAEAIDDRVAFAWAALARAASVPDHVDLNTVVRLFAQAYAVRDQLSASGRACLALAAAKFGTREQIDALLRNLDNGVQRSSAAGLGETVYWGSAQNYWRASDGAVESTALTLLALLELDSKSELIEPAANWLVLNRRSSHWSSTRATAFAVLALDGYLKIRGGLDATGEVELLANGQRVTRLKFSRSTLLDTESPISIPAALLRNGTNSFQLRRLSGSNPLHVSAIASAWARGDDVKPASHLLEVGRLFERQKTQPTLIGTVRVTPESLDAAGHEVQAGEEVTARITLHVPNDLEYVMIEVPKPAGCEPLNPLSGWDARIVRVENAGPKRSAPPSFEEGRVLYREERDDRSVFFLDRIDAGVWELRFGMRAIVSGDFRALPVSAEAMYVPEISANSDARRVRISQAPRL